VSATVSVIVPTRDRPRLLADALHSIVRQDIGGRGPAGIEIVVVNDGGGDIAAALPLGVRGVTIRVVSSARTRGQAAARNSGLDLATGRYVAFLDDDDVYLPGHLNRAVTTLEHSGADLVYADCLLADHRTPRDVRPDPHAHRYDFPYDPDMLTVTNFIPTSSVVCRNPAVFGPASWFRFDPELQVLVDWALWLRLVHDHGWSFVRTPEPGVVHHRVPGEETLLGCAYARPASLGRYDDTYRTIIARWPVSPTGRIARYRSHVLQMLQTADSLIATGQRMEPFAYEGALRVLYDGFTGARPDPSVPLGVTAVLTGLLPPVPDRLSQSENSR
jgi:glycosyltransferase involved in cell wall biosynthesis